MGKRSREKKERREKGEFKPQKETPQSGPVSLCLKVIKGGTFLTLLTPLIMSSNFFFPFVGPKSLYFMAFAQIIFFAWLILMIYSPKFRPRLNALLIALVLFLVVLTFSSLFGENFSYSFWSKPERMTGLLMWFHLFGFFLAISSVFQKKDWVRIFYGSIIIGVILSFIAFFSENPSMKGGATLGNTSFLGTFLLFNIFLAFYLIVETKFKEKKDLKFYGILAALSVFLLIMLYAVYSINARASTLSAFIGFGLLFLLYLAFASLPEFLGSFRRYLNVLGKISLAVVAILFLISSFYLFQPDNVIHDWFVERATYARLVVWEKAWQGFLERPFFGWGPENFEFVFAKHFNPCMFLGECGGEIWFDRAHNIVFDSLATTGLIGFLSYILIFLSVFYLLWKNYFKRNIDFWTTGIFSVLLIAYFIQNLTVFDMVSSFLMLFLVLGFIASVVVPKEEIIDSPKTVFQKSSSWPVYLILILFVFSFFYFIIQPFKTDYYAIDALKAPPASRERLDFFEKTLKSSSLGKYQIRDFFGQVVLELAQSENLKNIPAENFKKEIDFVIEEMEKSAKEAPLDFRSLLKLGQLYNAYAVLIDQTKISEAEKFLEKAIEVSPTNQQGYWSLAQTRIYQGRFDEALSLAEKAIELEPRLFQSHRIAVYAARIKKDEDLIERKISEAVEINPEWEKLLRETN